MLAVDLGRFLEFLKGLGANLTVVKELLDRGSAVSARLASAAPRAKRSALGASADSLPPRR